MANHYPMSFLQIHQQEHSTDYTFNLSIQRCLLIAIVLMLLLKEVQGLSVVKEDDEKPATEKESIFKGESVYVKMLNQVVDLFEEGNKNKSDEELKIVIEGSSKMLNAPKTPQAGRDLFNDLKSKYNVFNKNVRVGTFINNLRASLKKTDTERDTKNKVIQAEVDSFGKSERKERNTIESNLLKIWMINRIQRRRQRLSWISTKNLRHYRTQIQTRGMQCTSLVRVGQTKMKMKQFKI
mmetsp:Transcript_23063/g.38642  ORF Transcript_23063/g.38642 Transcript_23063/m.38642 type:complete len:238 (-) Transcript_23063:1125-1838(-)